MAARHVKMRNSFSTINKLRAPIFFWVLWAPYIHVPYDPRDLGGRAKLDPPGPQWQSGGKGPFRRPASLAFATSVRVQP